MRSFFHYQDKKKKTRYYNSTESQYDQFGISLKQMTEDLILPGQDLLFLCIGTDRITGDCLGPLTGELLSSSFRDPGQIYGTLKCPVHAQNLSSVLSDIHSRHRDPFLIVIDASLGHPGHIGYITLSPRPLFPGEGVHKSLPPLGSVSITGIVNESFSGKKSPSENHLLLQGTRLYPVTLLSRYIYLGIFHAFRPLFRPEVSYPRL